MLCASFLSHVNILRALHSMRCTIPNFSTLPPRTSTLRAPLIKLSRDNIYPHFARTNKIPLRSVNTAHITCANITHVPLNLYYTMLNLVRTPEHQYFPCITTLHRKAPNLNMHTRAPIFSTRYHSIKHNAKFKCRHPRTNIFRMLPLCTTQRQILVCTPARQYFPCITTLYRTTPNLSVHTRAPIFSARYHSVPRNAKFKCAQPCANIFRALPLCIAQRQF
jgi:hypothetical protein